MPLPICLLGFVNRTEMLRGTTKPEPLLSVGPRTSPLMVFGTTWVIYALMRAGVQACPQQELHRHSKASFPKFLSFGKQRGHEKVETVGNPEIGV